MATSAPARERLLTIGTVCRRLKPEFPDISISKIRYLEDQGLLTPKRTQGGYRLFGEDDVERLETILRLQRDEFLPLRVIREELAAGRGHASAASAARRSAEEEDGLELDELCERAGIEPSRARELEEFGLLEPRVDRRPARLLGDGSRCCTRVRDARAVRDRAAPPARVPHCVRPRDRAPRSARRARASVAQPGAPPGRASRICRRCRRRRRSSSQLLFTRNVRRLAGQLMATIDLKSMVREVPDFPKPGIGFKDITPLLLDPEALRQSVASLADWTAEREPDLVLGAEARGFWLGAAIACKVGCGFVPARRPGKLPPGHGLRAATCSSTARTLSR